MAAPPRSPSGAAPPAGEEETMSDVSGSEAATATARSAAEGTRWDGVLMSSGSAVRVSEDGRNFGKTVASSDRHADSFRSI